MHHRPQGQPQVRPVCLHRLRVSPRRGLPSLNLRAAGQIQETWHHQVRVLQLLLFVRGIGLESKIGSSCARDAQELPFRQEPQYPSRGAARSH